MASPSSSSIRIAARSSGLSLLRDQRTTKVFEVDLFDTYVARLTRREIASQFIDDSHQVLADESRLIQESERALKAHLEANIPEWNISWRLSKMVVIQYIRRLAKQRLQLHDVDDDVRENALEAIYKNDFESIFPKSWCDA